MLQEEFGHIRVIMIPPHTTSFLQPCDVGLMRPFKVDAIVMMSNEPTDTLHRIWQSVPRCLGAT